MQTIIDYLLHQLESEDVEEIGLDDIYNFLDYLLGNEMDTQQMVDKLGLYEMELERVAFEGKLTSTLLGRLLVAPAIPAQGYVVGL